MKVCWLCLFGFDEVVTHKVGENDEVYLCSACYNSTLAVEKHHKGSYNTLIRTIKANGEEVKKLVPEK